jgi:hypothetical protein
MILVEVMTSYLNPAEQVRKLRAALVPLTEVGMTDEPDLGSFRGGFTEHAFDPR